MDKEEKMSAEIKVRLYNEEKELLKKSAADVGLNMSNYIRSIIFSNKKLVLLTEGSEIAKALFLIHTDLEYFCNNGGFPEESIRAIIAALNDVSTQLNTVSSKLTDIRTDIEEVDLDE